MSKIGDFLRARGQTLGFLAIILAVIYGAIAYSHATLARQEAALASPQQNIRDAAVQNLVGHGTLADTLINTENPNEDPTSEQNLKSVTIRQNAVDSVNRLAAAKKISLNDAIETLFQSCKDADKGVQGKATDGLVALAGQSDANLQIIVAYLSNGDPDFRAAAGSVLTKIGGQKAAHAADAVLTVPAAADTASSTLLAIGEASVPLLVAHLNDPARASDIAFREQILTMLDTIASPAAVSKLTELSGQTTQPSVQRLAQVALADTVLTAYRSVAASRDALTKAQDALTHATGKGRDAAAKAVDDAQKASMKTADALPLVRAAEPALSKVLSDTTADSLARSQAALALGRIGSGTAIQALIAALGDLDSRVRRASLAGVQTAGTAANPALTATLTQGSLQARAAAAEALASEGSLATQSTLNSILSLSTTPVEVRQAAIVGLSQSGNIAEIPALVRALSDPDGGVQTAASEALLTPSLAAAAIAPLVAALAAPTPAPFNASQTLSHMGSLIPTHVVPALKAAISSGSPQTQAWAAITLGQTKSADPAVLGSLQYLKKSSDIHVQYAATQALSQLTGS